MSLKKYLAYLKIWITVFPYFVVGMLYRTYPSRAINNEFYFYLYCILFGFACGLIFCGITHLYDWDPFEPLILSFDETNILNNNDNTFEISEKNLKNQEEIKSAKKSICVWLVVTTVVYCAIFFAAINN